MKKKNFTLDALELCTSSLKSGLPLTELNSGEFSTMHYPKRIPYMHFQVKRYACESFGNIFTMYTDALFGLMRLCTIVCTPNRGTAMPLLLIDVMAFGKKNVAFVEYYAKQKIWKDSLPLFSKW